MGEVKFVLKQPNIKEATLIYLFYRFSNQTLKHSTGIKIQPKFWNPENQRARQSRLFKEGDSINETLETLSTTVRNAHRDLINAKRSPTPQNLKQELNKALFKEEFAQKQGFLKFIEDLTEQSTRMMNTKKQWKQTLRKLVEFKRATQREVDFDTIDLDFYNSFVHFLTKEGYTKNSIGGFIKNVKIFMNEAVDRKLTKNLEYRNRKFRVLEEKVDKIYLSQEELKSMYLLDLESKHRLEKVRDLFIIACYTGLRFSDLIQIRTENLINNGSQIKVRTEKTSETVIIPIHKYVKEILNKYNGILPTSISNQKMNEYLKEIAELAKINDSVKIAITRGGKTDNTVNKKFELVTTHTARRSFATNAYLMDIPSISIMKITGHRTEKSFMKYIRISQEENANKLLNHPFFN